MFPFWKGGSLWASLTQELIFCCHQWQQSLYDYKKVKVIALVWLYIQIPVLHPSFIYKPLRNYKEAKSAASGNILEKWHVALYVWLLSLCSVMASCLNARNTAWRGRKILIITWQYKWHGKSASSPFQRHGFVPKNNGIIDSACLMRMASKLRYNRCIVKPQKAPEERVWVSSARLAWAWRV